LRARQAEGERERVLNVASLARRCFAPFEGVCDPRPLCLFRILLYLGALLHFVPGFLAMEENYSASAYRHLDWNPYLFSLLPSLSAGVVRLLALATVLCLVCGMLGVLPRLSGFTSWLLTYTFASFNSVPVQTLFLLCLWSILLSFSVLGGGNEALSLPSMVRGTRGVGSLRLRRLIVAEILIALHFSGVEKLTSGWLTTNFMHHLLSYPEGALLRDWAVANAITTSAAFGWAMTWATLAFELLGPLCVFFARARLVFFVVYELFFLGIAAMIAIPPLAYLTFAPAGLLLLDDRHAARILFGARGLDAA
jgi:hypothetical protein